MPDTTFQAVDISNWTVVRVNGVPVTAQPIHQTTAGVETALTLLLRCRLTLSVNVNILSRYIAHNHRSCKITNARH